MDTSGDIVYGHAFLSTLLFIMVHIGYFLFCFSVNYTPVHCETSSRTLKRSVSLPGSNVDEWMRSLRRSCYSTTMAGSTHLNTGTSTWQAPSAIIVANQERQWRTLAEATHTPIHKNSPTQQRARAQLQLPYSPRMLADVRRKRRLTELADADVANCTTNLGGWSGQDGRGRRPVHLHREEAACFGAVVVTHPA
jgi:hypothetical protein